METMLTAPTEIRERGPKILLPVVFLDMVSHLRKVLRKASQDQIQLNIRVNGKG